ncbi:MAG: hypothetical protein CMF37_13210 [Leeuwenhoekiella sp.]|nr:hypothetical protein [Leeuwenhoekiella sp.]HAX14175.1 hypothetical protein [Leeuwenhoekiella sp.]HBO28550.1 hypothetical protein [Leeuwenhoekiella sp.]|tara:strand:- start:366 stop:899 length:534 start_codon:yes stop_codon:yes gene_type:complete
MNKTFFNILLVFTLFACNNDDNSNSNPLSHLPPATETGENTFGCLLDGEPFIPKGGVNPLDCVYQLVDGKRYFNLEAAMNDASFNEIAISISTNAKQISENETYSLMSEFEVGGVSGKYIFNGDIFDTDNQNSGKLTITKLDLDAQIVSGTFFFDVIDQNGELREIRDGRFDMRFTQ